MLGICAPALADPHAFPVPYVEKDDSSQGISFTDLPASGTIKILTITGEEVIKLDIPQGAGIAHWKPVQTSNNKAVATGVYFFLVEGGNHQSTGKLVVIR